MKILMIGESLERQGGIVSVEKIILQQAPPKFTFNHITTLPNGSFVYKIFIFQYALLKLVWRFLRGEADIVHIHVSERGSAYRHMITALISLIFDRPVVIHTHGANFHDFYSQLPPWIQQCMSWIFGKSTRFIVLSESWKKFYVDNLHLKVEQVVVLPNPAKLPSIVPNRMNPPRVNFVFLGRIGHRKGAFDVIEAFTLLSTEHKRKAKLTLAGDGETEKARDLVTKMGLAGCVDVLDWIDDDQRDELLANSNVFVLPSYNEGLPMALIEAMSWGLAVITTSVGGIPELITHGKNGLLVGSGNCHQLSETIKLLIDNEELRLTLGSNARASVTPMDIKIYMDSLVNIYNLALVSKNINQKVVR